MSEIPPLAPPPCAVCDRAAGPSGACRSHAAAFARYCVGGIKGTTREDIAYVLGAGIPSHPKAGGITIRYAAADAEARPWKVLRAGDTGLSGVFAANTIAEFGSVGGAVEHAQALLATPSELPVIGVNAAPQENAEIPEPVAVAPSELIGAEQPGEVAHVGTVRGRTVVLVGSYGGLSKGATTVGEFPLTTIRSFTLGGEELLHGAEAAKDSLSLLHGTARTARGPVIYNKLPDRSAFAHYDASPVPIAKWGKSGTSPGAQAQAANNVRADRTRREKRKQQKNARRTQRGRR